MFQRLEHALRYARGMATAVLDRPTTCDESLIEYVSSAGSKPKVDRENGVIEGVKILGLQSANGRTYTRDAARNAISLYEGALIYLNHPPPGKENQPRGYQEKIGSLSAVKQDADGGLSGNLNYNPKHALAEQLAWDAERAPQTLGLSHNVAGKTRTENGRVIVEEITAVRSVDLVTRPATTKSLYEHQEDDDMDIAKVTVEQIKSRPDLVEAILAEQKNSQAAQDQAKELKTLREELDRYKAQDAASTKRKAVDKLIETAKLPKELVTDIFAEQLMAADDKTQKALIEDRQLLAKGLPGKPTRPISRDSSRDVTEQRDADRKPIDSGKSFVGAITRR